MHSCPRTHKQFEALQVTWWAISMRWHSALRRLAWRNKADIQAVNTILYTVLVLSGFANVSVWYLLESSYWSTANFLKICMKCVRGHHQNSSVSKLKACDNFMFGCSSFWLRYIFSLRYFLNVLARSLCSRRCMKICDTDSFTHSHTHTFPEHWGLYMLSHILQFIFARYK